MAQFYTRDGTPLKARDNSGYRTSGGNLAAYDEFKPGFNTAVYADVSLFLPYRELNITEPGVHALKFFLLLNRYERNGQTIGKSADFNFKYTKS